MNAVTAWIQRLGPVRLAAVFGVTAIVAAALFALLFRIGGEEKALLYADLDLREAGEIAAKLESANITHELRGDGSAIYVARSQVLDARMMLSAEGLPSSGSVGYEIFDQQSALGATQFQQNINRLRALEGELARTIVSLDGVRKARVHLVLPERRLFDRQEELATASIVVDVTAPLGASQVRAMRNLAAGAVPGLRADRVTVLDQEGRLLAAGGDAEAGAGPDGANERQAAAEARIRSVVQDIVESVVGPGAARVQVSLDMDFNRVTQNVETYDPEGRVVRSTQTVEETNASQEREAEGGATAARNVPDGEAANDEAQSSETGQRTEETINYEISRTLRTEVIEGGRIRKLSVAVAVDGVTTPGAEGAEPQWAPREADELERIAALVRSAVGFDEARGDVVEVVNVRFARSAAQGTEASEASPFDLSTLEPMRLIELGAALIAALALVFFVLRPLINNLFGAARGAAAASLTIAGPGGAPALAAAGGGGAVAALSGPSGEADDGVDLQRIKGKVSASSMKQIGDIIEQHPEESVAILRGWINNAT